MSILSKTEIEKLSIMYEGDQARDASSKIRGFLFQDYITIMCLLKNEAEYVCTEYLEDINVFYKDGTFEVIQVKYYPKTSPDMKEITTDLYYQYLRAQMLQSKLKAVPRLYIHRKARTTAIENLTVEKMEENIGLGSMLPKSRDYPKLEEVNEWLRTNVYIESKKEAQKKKLFSTMASEISLKSFVEKFDVSHQEDINQYKEELMKKLAAVYPNPVENGEEEHWRVILLGLAITYVQRRYVLENPKFDQLRMSKAEFDQYMKESAETEKEQTIASYLVGVACEKYGEIINYNDLSDLQLHMLNLIYQNTLRWLSEIGQSVEGQYQLVNTLSCREFSQISDYKEKSIKEICQISNFSYEMLVSKLNAIDSVLANQDLAKLMQKLEAANKKNQNLDMEIKDLDNLKKIAEKRAEDIEKVIDSLSKEEYEKVGPSLGKFYNKLARVNSSGGINIVQKNNGISLVDDKEKNIVNILSNGQISVFMLSYFFAGINARNDSEKMKVYFIDDLTACMDDVNMLAFMDLLKYQMSSKATMEQLFFITCDDRISKLLKYKLSGREIELCELSEKDFEEINEG